MCYQFTPRDFTRLRFVKNWRITLVGIVTLSFTIGYGMFLGDMFVLGLEGLAEIAVTIMGAVVWLALVITFGLFVWIEDFLGYET